MVSSTTELLLLKWNSYEANYHSAFSEIRENNKFYDVTIATHDGHALAHRVILSACSPVLAKILDLNCHPQPLIYIRGIPISHITTILDFMYKGEAHVSHDSIGEFLISAEELKVKGLSKDKGGDEDLSKDLDSGSQNGFENDLISQDASNQLANQTIEPFLIKERNIFDAEGVEEERMRQNCEEDTIPQKNTTILSTSNNKTVITKNISIPIRIRSPKTINSNFEEIASKTIPGKLANCMWCGGEWSVDLNKCVNCKRKLPEDPKKINDPGLDKNMESKRKSELVKKIESVIDSVLQQTASDGEIAPKVRKVSPELNEEHFLVDSNGASFFNSFQEYDHFLHQSDNPDLAGSEEIETDEYGCAKLILTKSAEDKARFRGIVSSMLIKSASNDGGLECLVCGKQFSGKNNATSHVDHMHTDHLLHKCHVCDVIKNTSVALTRHMKSHKSDQILGIF